MAEGTVTFRLVLSLTMKSQEHKDGYWGFNDDSKNLSKMHRTAYMETVALNSINIHSRKGEFVAVMGPSSFGKSALLNMVGMIDTPNSGEHFFDAVEITSRSENHFVDLRK